MKDYAEPTVVKSNKTSKACYAFGAVVYMCFSGALAYAILGGAG